MSKYPDDCYTMSDVLNRVKIGSSDPGFSYPSLISVPSDVSYGIWMFFLYRSTGTNTYIYVKNWSVEVIRCTPVFILMYV